MILLNDKEECKKCHGRKCHGKQIISMLNICNHCGGRGEVDWIDNMTGNPSPRPPDEVFKSSLAMKNVQMLMSEIKTIMYTIGIQATVTVEQGVAHTHYAPSYTSISGRYGNHNHMVAEVKRNVLITI